MTYYLEVALTISLAGLTAWTLALGVLGIHLVWDVMFGDSDHMLETTTRAAMLGACFALATSVIAWPTLVWLWWP